jgi:8-oxo-dGTP pyrophosphatase MutT (NUDIX family)
MKKLSLLFLYKENEILLALKKRGFGQGLWNGVGGKQQLGENIKETAIRECQEEILVTPKSLNNVAKLMFNYADGQSILVYVYLSEHWQGEPKESEEMKPQWFNFNDIPFQEMWPDDQYWLPKIINKDKVKAAFNFDTNNRIIDHQLDVVDTL